MSMIEKVAYAIFQSRYPEAVRWWNLSGYVDKDKLTAMKDARAAIEAMREPTEVMLEAVSSFNDIKHIDQDPSYYWPLMIDAALKENE